MVLGALGKEVASKHLDPRGLSELLESQKRNILDDPRHPHGLAQRLGARGLSDVGELGPRVSVVQVNAPRIVAPPQQRLAAPRPPPKEAPWAKIIGAATIAALAIWGIIGLTNRSKVAEIPPLPSAIPTVAIPSPPVLPSPPPSVEITGAQVPSGAQAGPLSNLQHALSDDSVPLPQTFDITPLNFERGTTVLTDESRATIGPLAQLLAAHPSARVAIMGFTDSSGNADRNRTLSAERAEAIKRALVDQGVPGERMDTSGQGPDAPIAPNDTHEGRVMNRRVEIELLSR